jgi:hypothetical protein
MKQLKEDFIIYVARHVLPAEVLDALNEILFYGLSCLAAIHKHIYGILSNVLPNALKPL